MRPEYAEWIAANVPDPHGTCRETTEAMQIAFPELKRVRGHYYCWVGGERPHWWLYDENGDVVDPTASQFGSKGLGHYEEWDETQPEPTGMCPNCGDHCYDGRFCCTPACDAAYIAFCSNPL